MGDCYTMIKHYNKELYGVKDKRTLKSLRNLAIAQSKKKMYKEALDTIREIEEAELQLYGEKSKHISKTYTLKATLLFRCDNKVRAKELMRKAIMIYEEIGDKNAAKGVRDKLKIFEERN